MTLPSLSILSRGLKNPPKTVWLDCVDCCEIKSGEKGLYVGAGKGSPKGDHEGIGMITEIFLILQEAGLAYLQMISWLLSPK